MKSTHRRRARTAQSRTSRLGVAVKRRRLRFRLHKHTGLDTVIRSVERGNRVVIGRRDEDLAALVPLRDYELLEQLSSRSDVLALLAALDAEAAAARKGQQPIPWETARQRLQ